MDETLHGLVEQRLRQNSQRHTSGRRAVVDLLATVNGFLSLDHRLDVLGACASCREGGDGAPPVAGAAAGPGRGEH